MAEVRTWAEPMDARGTPAQQACALAPEAPYAVFVPCLDNAAAGAVQANMVREVPTNT